MIGVTAFFRDPDSFDRLKDEVLPRIFDGRESDDPVRIWVPGCASGEEAYSLAMLCQEYITAHGGGDFQIFASDVNERALAEARQGIYPAEIAENVSEERLMRFFVKKSNRFDVRSEVRDKVLFLSHNLIRDPPFTKQDLISCRNLLIYLDPPLQQDLICLFHFSLRPNGFLFVGSSESALSHSDLFLPVGASHPISQRQGTAIGGNPLSPLQLRQRDGDRSSESSPRDDDRTGVRQMMHRVLLDEFAPKSVLVDEDGQVICSSAETSEYLCRGEGTSHNDVFKMARRGLRTGLRAALAEAKMKRRRVTHENLTVQTETGRQRVMLTVQPMTQLGEQNNLFLIVFHEVGLPTEKSVDHAGAKDKSIAIADLGRHADTVIEELERELEMAQDDLDRSHQEFEATNEELKSSNEELLSLNEELQSANEELKSSREELQTTSEAIAASS